MHRYEILQEYGFYGSQCPTAKRRQEVVREPPFPRVDPITALRNTQLGRPTSPQSWYKDGNVPVPNSSQK
jgi:hypothetical protein